MREKLEELLHDWWHGSFGLHAGVLIIAAIITMAVFAVGNKIMN